MNVNIISILDRVDTEGHNTYRFIGYTTDSKVVAALLRYNMEYALKSKTSGTGSIFRIQQVYPKNTAQALQIAQQSLKDLDLPEL